MKTFIISAILLVAVICAVWINALFVADTAELLRSLTSAIQEHAEPEKAADELFHLWQERRHTLSISVDLSMLERIEENVISLKAACIAGHRHEIQRLCRIIDGLCNELAQYERISFYSIL